MKQLAEQICGEQHCRYRELLETGSQGGHETGIFKKLQRDQGIFRRKKELSRKREGGRDGHTLIVKTLDIENELMPWRERRTRPGTDGEAKPRRRHFKF